MRGTGTVHRGSPAHPTLPHQGRDNRQARRSMTGKPPVLRSSPRAVSQRQREHTRPRAASTSVVENKGTRGKESNIRKCLEKMFLCSLTWKKKSKYTARRYMCLRKLILMNLLVQRQLEFESCPMEVVKSGGGGGGKGRQGKGSH